ncbi:MAG: SDR family oxidoreductase [Anaerolineae bacterium]|nr:SDR family oxidoreductase [Anaerolineae bacterium]
MDLQDKVAIVTGGAVRLGRAQALALGERGVRVVVHYGASAGPAEEVVRLIEASGSEAIAVQADLNAPHLAPTLVDRAVRTFGHVDILVNSAAIFEQGDWDDTTEENWDRHFDINLKSPFFLTQAFARQVDSDRRGHVINIADWRAVRPGTGHVAYTLTKAALVAMTESLAQALAPNIQVNAIAPGLILPPPGHGPEYMLRHAPTIPAQRTGAPLDIVRALLYLLDADFVTGQLLYVTGGEHLLAGRQP